MPRKTESVPPSRVRRMPLAELFSDTANVRKHDERNLAAIAGSLKQFGQVEPLVVQKGTGRVIGGNGRLEVMRQLEWDDAEVLEVDLSATQATALAIALNRTGELAAWDFEGLAGLLRGLRDDGFDLNSLGWAEHELGPLLAAEWAPPEQEDVAFTTEPDAIPPIEPNAEQRRVFDLACARIRASGEKATDGECLEIISAEFMKGAT